MRYDDVGKPIQSFILNQEPFNKSKILIAEKILDAALQESTLRGLY